MKIYSLAFLLLFSLQALALTPKEINPILVNQWHGEREYYGWSYSYQKKVLSVFSHKLEQRIKSFLPDASLSKTKELFEGIILELRDAQDDGDNYQKIISLGLKTAFFITLHHHRLGEYKDEEMQWAFLFDDLTNQSAMQIDFMNIFINPKDFGEHLFSLTNYPVDKDEYSNFNFMPLAEAVTRTDIFIVPTMEELDIPVFVRLSPIRVYPLGVSFSAINIHDGARWDPFIFFMHDVGHAISQMKGISGHVSSNLKHYQNILHDWGHLNREAPLIAESVTLILFQLLHEKGKSFCQLSENNLAHIDSESSVSLVAEKVKYNIYPFINREQFKAYLNQGIIWLLPRLNSINCYENPTYHQ